MADSSVGYYTTCITHHFSSLHCVLVFCIYFNDFRLCFCSQSQMQLQWRGQVVPCLHPSHLPAVVQLCGDQSRQATCGKLMFAATCVSTRGCQELQGLISAHDPSKDGPSDCETMALGFTLIVKESSCTVTNSLKCTWPLC